MDGKIKQIIPLPADTTVLCECHASEKDWYYPYLYDAVELGGFLWWLLSRTNTART